MSKLGAEQGSKFGSSRSTVYDLNCEVVAVYLHSQDLWGPVPGRAVTDITQKERWAFDLDALNI